MLIMADPWAQGRLFVIIIDVRAMLRRQLILPPDILRYPLVCRRVWDIPDRKRRMCATLIFLLLPCVVARLGLIIGTFRSGISQEYQEITEN